MILAALGCFVLSHLHANPLDLAKRASLTVHDHYNLIIDFFQNKQWKRLIWQADQLAQDFPETSFAKEIAYYQGVAYYEFGEYELANDLFSKYLQGETPKFFDQAIRYKFQIACRFQEGVRRHLFHVKTFPKWVHGYEEAIAIFDEVITTMPRDEMAAESLYRKGILLLDLEEYQRSVESYQTLIRRFPKHYLAPESYLGITQVYLTRSQKEFAGNDHLDSVEINLRKFRFHFPSDPRLAEAEKIVIKMKELMAKDLLEIGDYYRRTKHPKAAAIYYQTILKKYPSSRAAKTSKERLKKLKLPETFSEMKQTEEKAQDHPDGESHEVF